MADISLEAVAGKLNRVGYEAFFQALRQAKGAAIATWSWRIGLPTSCKTSAATSR